MLVLFVNTHPNLGDNIVKVTTGVPIPTEKRNYQRKYPFNELGVGDSIEFEDTDTFEKARRAAQFYGKAHSVTFTCRKGIQDGEFCGEGGTIWRKG